MSDGIDYPFPFLQMMDLKEYPEIYDKINFIFPDEKEDVKKNLYLLMTNLLLSSTIAVARSPEAFENFPGPEWYTRKNAVRAQDLLVERNLVTLRRGLPPVGGLRKGLASEITSTYKLYNILEGTILKAIRADPTVHPILTFDRKPLALEDIANMDGANFTKDSPLTRKILEKAYDDTSLLNEHYFKDIKLGFWGEEILTLEGKSFEEARYLLSQGRKAISMATNVFVTSMFSPRGDGRLFQRCNSYQYVKKEDRKFLTINDSKTSELDFSSMHINLAYYLSLGQNPHLDDSYSAVIKKLGAHSSNSLREAVKKCIIIAFNTPTLKSCSSAMRWRHPRETAFLKQNKLSIKDVYDTFLNLNPILKDFFNHSVCRANELMFYESQIMRGILKDLKKQKIYALPIHDSIICKRGDKEYVAKTMKKIYEETTGNEIKLKLLR